MLPSAGPTSEAGNHMPEGLVVVAVGIEVVWVRVLYVDTLAFKICFLDYDTSFTSPLRTGQTRP